MNQFSFYLLWLVLVRCNRVHENHFRYDNETRRTSTRSSTLKLRVLMDLEIAARKRKNDDKLSWLVRFHKHVYLKKDGFFGFWHRSYSWLISFRNSACTTEKARKCHCFVVEITRERITASWSTKGWCGMLFRSSSSYKLQTYPILSLVCRRENKSIRFRFHATHSIWL